MDEQGRKSDLKTRAIFFFVWTLAVSLGGFFIARAVLEPDDEEGKEKEPDSPGGDGGGGGGGGDGGGGDGGGGDGGGGGNGNSNEESEVPEDEGIEVGTFWQIIIGLQYLAFIVLILVKDKNPVLVASVLLVYIVLCDIQIFSIPNSVTDGTVSGVVVLVTLVFWLNRLALSQLEKLTFTLGMLSIFILSVVVNSAGKNEDGLGKYLDAEPNLQALPFISFLAFAVIAAETGWQIRRMGRFKFEESYTTWLEDQLRPEITELGERVQDQLAKVKPYEDADSADLTAEDRADADAEDMINLELTNKRRELESRVQKIQKRVKRREAINKAFLLLGELATIPEIPDRSKKKKARVTPGGTVE